MRPLKNALPTLNALAVFESAARHSNLTRSAEELNISQSAVSRHIANLENQTGFVLFNRNGTKITLTVTGQRLADAVGFGLRHIKDALDVMRQEAEPNRITIASSYDVASLWLLPRFAALREAMPGVQCRLLTSDAYVEFNAPEVDLSLRFGRGPWPGMSHLKLYNEEIFPVCAPRLLKQFPRLTKSAEALATSPLIFYRGSTPEGLEWDHWFSSLGLVAPKAKHENTYSSYMFVIERAVAGHGAALGWRGIIDGHLAAGVLRQLPGRPVKSRDGIYAVYPTSRGEGVVPAVAAWLKASAASVFPPMFGTT